MSFYSTAIIHLNPDVIGNIPVASTSTIPATCCDTVSVRDIRAQTLTINKWHADMHVMLMQVNLWCISTGATVTQKIWCQLQCHTFLCSSCIRSWKDGCTLVSAEKEVLNG